MGLKSSLFVTASGLLALPFLTPCTLGLGVAGAKLVNKASGGLDDSTDSSRLRDRRLQEWSRLPGPAYQVDQGVVVSRAALVSDLELKDARQAPSEFSFSRKVKSVMDGVSLALMATDATTVAMLDSKTDSSILMPEFSRRPRPQMVVSENPWLVLSGYDLRYVLDPATGRILRARSAGAARISIITPQGASYALASRIHFDASCPELLLEGKPSFHSGDQWVKSGKSDARMTLHPASRTLRLSVQADEE
jgi:hypothetical protein